MKLSIIFHYSLLNKIYIRVMLSGKGNENGTTTIGLISKKATLHVQHIFLYISLPLF